MDDSISGIELITNTINVIQLKDPNDEESETRDKEREIPEIGVWSQDKATNRFVMKLCWVLEDVTNFHADHKQHCDLLHRLEKLVLGVTKRFSQVFRGHIVHALCLYKRAPKQEILDHPSTDRIYTIFLISLILTCKDCFDDFFQTFVWTPYCTYTVHQLNTMERRFLRICDYHIQVHPLEYAQQVAILA